MEQGGGVPAPVTILSPGDYLGYHAPVHGGVGEGTHLAQMRLNGEILRCVVKIYPASSHGIFNELLGYCLARSLGLPQPRHAALAFVPVAALPERPAWIASGEPEWPAWVTEWVPKKSIKPWFDQMKGAVENPPDRKTKKALRRIAADLRKWRLAPSVCAFDDWTGNPDRNMGNLIRMGRGSYVIIDHGCLFAAKPWTRTPPGFDVQTRNLLRMMLGCGGSVDGIQSKMFMAGQKYEFTLANHMQHVLEFLNHALDEKARRFVESFLRYRADEQFRRRLYGLMI